MDNTLVKCCGLNANHAVLNASINFFDIFFGEINAKYAISDLPRASGKVPSHFWGVLNAAINAAGVAGNLPKAVFRADSAGLDVLNPAVSVYSVVRNSTAAVNDAGQGNQSAENFALIAYYATGCFAGISVKLTSGFARLTETISRSVYALPNPNSSIDLFSALVGKVTFRR